MLIMPDVREAFIGISMLIAVTAIIGILFFQWMIGFITSFEIANIQILHSSYIDCSNKILYLHVRNLGDAPVTIQMIEIVGFERIDSSTRFSRGESYVPIIINPKSDRVISIPLTKNYINGIMYQIRVYTSIGKVYTAIINAE